MKSQKSNPKESKKQGAGKVAGQKGTKANSRELSADEQSGVNGGAMWGNSSTGDMGSNMSKIMQGADGNDLNTEGMQHSNSLNHTGPGAVK